MGQSNVTVKNLSDFDSVEIAIDGREPCVISKGRSVEIQLQKHQDNQKGTGKLRVHRQSKLIRECSFQYQAMKATKHWEVTNDGLTQVGVFTTPKYNWSFVDDS